MNMVKVDGRFNGTAVADPLERGEILLTGITAPFALKIANNGDRVLKLAWEGVLPAPGTVTVPPGSDVLMVHDKALGAGPLKWEGKTYGVWEATLLFE